ncbi:hypothetical protein IY145_00665 [Methylosinus sp. H3A]|nr:DUF6880 family protein [Methylosinus sp. H3A]MBG0807943.1 hypothetical protein [Methylosinus sp. H3A]
MAPKNTLNAQNLEALGAERLAELLMEISSGDAAIKRRLRLALAGARGPSDAKFDQDDGARRALLGTGERPLLTACLRTARRSPVSSWRISG